jgi:hypothetical protein
MNIDEFNTRCAAIVSELHDMLLHFDDDTDPAGIAKMIAARYLIHYLGPNFLDALNPRMKDER